MRRGSWAVLCGIVAVLSVVTVLVFVGGGESGSGIAVSGSVISGGEPVQKATILFVPAKGTSGPSVRGDIENGSYRISAQEGLQPGRYMVTVSLAGAPSKKDGMSALFKKVSKAGSPIKFDREVTRENSQIDFEL